MKFKFKDAYKAKYERAYQVTRSEFDELLLDHSAESGATVMEETAVEQIVFGKNEIGITINNAGISAANNLALCD